MTEHPSPEQDLGGDTPTAEPLQEKIDPLQTVDGLKDLLLRTQASFENYRKQMQKRLDEMQQMAARDVILQVLPLLDNLELALKNANAANPQDFIHGVELILGQAGAFLEQRGVTPMITVGQKFDPFLHEALLRVPSDQPENIILEEFQRGFTLHGKVIRHAKVKISKLKKEIARIKTVLKEKEVLNEQSNA